MNLKTTDQRALLLLLVVTALLLTLGLGSRELWGAETRWANISLQMLQSGDYFDPYLKGGAYYDKPLLSYWLITASAWLTGGLGPWSLRLSTVVAAWLSVWLTYLLGERLFRKGTGLVAGWPLAPPSEPAPAGCAAVSRRAVHVAVPALAPVRRA